MKATRAHLAGWSIHETVHKVVRLMLLDESVLYAARKKQMSLCCELDVEVCVLHRPARKFLYVSSTYFSLVVEL